MLGQSKHYQSKLKVKEQLNVPFRKEKQVIRSAWRKVTLGRNYPNVVFGVSQIVLLRVCVDLEVHAVVIGFVLRVVLSSLFYVVILIETCFV